MKKSIILLIALSLILCGCSSSFDVSKGSVLDENFIHTFPFRTCSLSEAADWFNEQSNYKIEETSVANSSLEVTYHGSVKWDIYACCDVYDVDGFAVILRSIGDYSENDYSTIFDCIIDELSGICGVPTQVYDSGSMEFYYGNLRILVDPAQTGISIEMYHHS